MNERILKSDQTKEGERIVVNARQLVETFRVPGPDDEDLPGEPALSDDAPADDEEYLLPSDRAKNEAERIVGEAEQMAQDIAAQAEAEATKKIEETEAEVEQLISQTMRELESQREVLEREARERAEAEYRERYLAAVTALEGAAAQLRREHEEYLKQIEQPAQRLVLAIARQLLGRELSQSPEFVAALIARACQLIKPDQVVTVDVHPATFMLLSEDDLLSDALRAAGIKPALVDLALDEALEPSQFKAHLAGLSIDYDLPEILAELITELEERFGQPDVEPA
ncbi:hypothetical protein JW859_07235 [bacterium]|nr:hypothetical protein [bacterium]